MFNDPNMLISVTAVRVPTVRAHAESISVEFNGRVTVDQVREMFRRCDNLLSLVSSVIFRSNELILKDDVPNDKYPMPSTASG